MANSGLKEKDQIGLTSEEAMRRHLLSGPNEIIPSRLESAFSQLKDVLLDPMGLMLLGLAGLYAILGDTADSIILAVAYIPVTAVDVFLQIRAGRALKALQASLKTTSKVFRDNVVQEIPTKNIVVGDVLVFEEGQALSADGSIIEAEELGVNEAALTGESVPVEKAIGDPFYGGTTVLRGRGMGLVESIGKATRFGKIASLLRETEAEGSPLQKKINALVRRVVLAAFILAVALFILEIMRGSGLVQSIIVAMTFGMAAVPEEFPLVFTLYLSLGAWRLSRHGVLVKSLPSVEALGSVDVICTDKTGTLTEGRFQLETLVPLNDRPKDLMWKCALMACEPTVVDTMEAAIAEKGEGFRHLLAGWRLEWDYPFELQGKHMSHVWRHESGKDLIAMKGAIEGILEHCQMTAQERAKVTEVTAQFASQGKRLLGLACREGQCVGNRESDERNLSFLGVLVFSDPVRKSAQQAISECQNAGIRIKMLTGDHPLTAHAVADEIGIEHSNDQLFTGGELARMPEAERLEAYRKGAVFSRVMPEQKHEMVKALKASGQVVAMTGDGINDAPALKLADIGISMGKNATDVARSTAQIILLNNDFKGIVEAVIEGRRIFSNLKRSFSYLISFHIPVILLAFTPPLLGWGDLLLPIHIVLLEMVVHPVSAYAFENLKQVESRAQKSVLSKVRFFEAGLSGVLLALGSLFLYRYFQPSLGSDGARTMALMTVLFGNIAFVVVESWPEKTHRLLLVTLGLLGLVLAITQIPQMRELFHLASVDMQAMSLAFGMGIAAAVPSFIVRFWRPNQ